MKQYIEVQIKNVTAEIKKYEAKTYDIFAIATMVNDRREYDRLIGERRCLEMMETLKAQEEKDKQIQALNAEVKALSKLTENYENVSDKHQVWVHVGTPKRDIGFEGTQDECQKYMKKNNVKTSTFFGTMAILKPHTGRDAQGSEYKCKQL